MEIDNTTLKYDSSDYVKVIDKVDKYINKAIDVSDWISNLSDTLTIQWIRVANHCIKPNHERNAQDVVFRTLSLKLVLIELDVDEAYFSPEDVNKYMTKLRNILLFETKNRLKRGITKKYEYSMFKEIPND